MGCHIYLIDETLTQEGEASLVPLSQQQVNHNRTLIQQEFSTEVLAKKLREGVTEILERNQFTYTDN